MNNQKLQNFIDLVAFDQSLSELESSISSVKNKIDTFQLELQKLENSLVEKEEEQKKFKKQLDLQELEVKSLQEKEQRQTEIVEKATNSREYDAAHHELEALKESRDKHEQKLMQLWNVHEQIEKAIAEVKEHKKAKEEDIKNCIAEENDILQKLKKDFEAKSEERNAKLAVVPDEWISLYNHMRGRVTNPVVPVAQESCSACFYIISSKDLQTLKQGELVQCKDCYRFLYDNASETSENHSE